MSALGGTLGVFLLILLIGRLKAPRTGKRAPLALAILIGAAAMGGLFRLPVLQFGSAALGALIAPRMIMLAITLLLLLSLSVLMQRSGQTERIVALARSLLRRPAVTMAAMPALIGLLPMPGGALFSAPMVQAAAGDTKADAGLFSAVNYWFRHIWEYWWPLYPGVLLALSYTKGGYGPFAAAQLPLGAGMVLCGLLIFRRTPGELHAAGARPPAGTKRKLLWATSSIWVIVLVWIPTYLLLKRVAMDRFSHDLQDALRKYGPVLAGLLVSFVWTVIITRHSLAKAAALFGRPSTYALIGLVVSVMIFQAILRETGAADQIARELASLHVPAELVVAILPAIAGMITGIAVGFVGVSFPIVIPVAAAAAGGGSILPFVVLAYGFGYLGMMLSPLHVCYVVSNRYFQTGFGPVYRRLLPTAAVMVVLISGYFALLRRLI